MEFVGKRAWMKKLEEDSSSNTISKNVQVVPSGMWVAGDIGKKKARAQLVATTHLTPQNVTFEGLNGLECRKWWQETSNDHFVKESIQRGTGEMGVADASILHS